MCSQGEMYYIIGIFPPNFLNVIFLEHVTHLDFMFMLGTNLDVITEH